MTIFPIAFPSSRIAWASLLKEETLRFNALKKKLPSISQRILTRQLRELERDGVLKRQVFAQVPPRVEYSLSPLGESLRPVIRSLEAWGTRSRAT